METNAGAYVFLTLSIITLIAGFSILIFKRKHKIWWFAGLMLVTVLLLQISLNIAYPYDFESEEKGTVLSGYELFTRVIAYTFQCFSLDAGYTQMIHVGELAFLEKAGAVIFQIMACIMTVFAPATGGFAVFGVLCHFFPYLKLLMLSYRRTKYVFSELNEYSIETAESIYNKIKNGKAKSGCGDKEWKQLKSSVIIFTDVYVDEEQEASGELLERAKDIGAVCLKNDISELKLFWFFRTKNKKVIYFLMDINEEHNLKTAVSVLSYNKNKWAAKGKYSLRARDMDLYAFNQDGNANRILKGAYDELIEQTKKAERKVEYKIVYKLINEFSNLVYQLISGNENSYPLYHVYRAGGHKDKIENLSVLILGGGKIGKEFFKASYWCGQMLSDLSVAENYVPDVEASLPFKNVKLKITVIAEDASEAEKNLKFSMPEVFDERYANYFDYRFFKMRYATSEKTAPGAKPSGFEQLFLKECADTDYVLVAMGSDDLNIQAAQWVKSTLDRINIFKLRAIPVNYVIENESLIVALNEADKNIKGCILHPFGSLTQRYNLDNIIMSTLEEQAWMIDQALGFHSADQKNDFINDAYGRVSGMAGAVHYPYKLVSFGMDGGNTQDNNFEKHVDAVIWLEHRRWCAYVRSTGYRCPTAKEFLTYAYNRDILSGRPAHKYEEIKLHACLIESGAQSINMEEYLKKFGPEDRKKLCEEWKTAIDGCPDNITLYEWLNKNILSGDKTLDALDRLGIFITVYYSEILKGTVKDLKNNDITSVRRQREYAEKRK